MTTKQSLARKLSAARDHCDSIRQEKLETQARISKLNIKLYEAEAIRDRLQRDYNEMVKQS